jgi:hypothetical protein
MAKSWVSFIQTCRLVKASGPVIAYSILNDRCGVEGSRDVVTVCRICEDRALDFHSGF